MDDQTRDTERVARRYFAAWTARDRPGAAAALADDFSFTSGDMVILGKDRFLDAGAFPAGATVTMETEAYQGDTGFQMYLAEVGGKSAHIVERLVVRDGLLQSSVFVTDMAAFMALAAEPSG